MEERLNGAGYIPATQDPTEKLGVTDDGPLITFTLFPIGEQLPPGYRLVTVREIHDHREALRRAMPGWEIANLADGSVDGMSYGGRTRMDRRDSVGHKLATQNPGPTYAKRNMQDRRVTYSMCMLPALLIVLLGILIILLVK